MKINQWTKRSQPGRPSTFVISITTFDENRALDESSLRLHFQRMAAAGIGVYAGGSSPGEGYSLSSTEAHRVLEIAVEELKGKVPVRAMGVEPRTASTMAEFGNMAESTGVDAIQIYSLDVGHGNKPTPSEIDQYFRHSIEAVSLPVVLSTHQSMGYTIPLDTLALLVADYPHIIGVNCTHPDLAYLTRMIDLVGHEIEIHVGGPMQALTALALGAHGFLTSEANFAPRLCQSVIDRYNKGDYMGASSAFGTMLRIFSVNQFGTSVRWNKAAMEVLGLPGFHLRDPHVAIDNEGKSRIRAAFQALDLWSIERLNLPN